MSRICQVTGKKTRVGNKKSRRGKAKKHGGVGKKLTGITKRKFKPNLHKKRIWVPELERFVCVRVTSRALRTMAKNGAYRTLVKAKVIKPVSGRKKAGKKKPAED